MTDDYRVVEDGPKIIPLADDRRRGKDDGRSKLKSIDLDDFLALDIPPREMLLAPILPAKGLMMLYAFRGVGKTHVAMGMAHAVASGGTFLRWKAPVAKRVLYVDGEMPCSKIKTRMREIIAGAPTKPVLPGMFKLLAADMHEGGLGNLADRKVQGLIDGCLAGIDLVVLDNLSSLTATIRDNDSESWQTIQDWLLQLRRRGLSVLIVHHAGKQGEQRGTSRREDVLDTSIALKRPKDYVPTEGARFEVHIEKGRGVYGDDAKPFEARLEVRYGAAHWTMREIEDADLARVAALVDDGLSIRDIAAETGISRSKVGRLRKRVRTEKEQMADIFERAQARSTSGAWPAQE